MVSRSRLRVPGKDLVEKIGQLFVRGDVRRVCLMDEEKSLLEIPINVGDPASPASTIAAPVLAAIKAFATLVTECTIEIEKVDRPEKAET